MTPTQPSSYLVGKVQILALRDEVQKKLGTQFDLARFHEQLLGIGTLPLGLVREELLEKLA
jgi:uncharacterized protein (DUF885 family)